MKQNRGGAISPGASHGASEGQTETLLPVKHDSVHLNIYEIHAFKCNGGTYLFVWVNRSGVKFVALYGLESYEECKKTFLYKTDATRLARQSCSLRELDRLNHSIVEKVETFTLL